MKLFTVILLLIVSNHLICKDDEIYLIHVDSVITYSFFGEKSTDLADSLYQYHHERLLKEVALFQNKLVHYISRYEECCFCTREEVAVAWANLLPIKEELERQENQLNRLRELCKNDYHAFAQELIIEVTVKYAAEHSIQSLIIDSSIVHVFPGITSSSNYLTTTIIQLIESDPFFKTRVNKLEQTIIERVNKDFETKKMLD